MADEPKEVMLYLTDENRDVFAIRGQMTKSGIFAVPISNAESDIDQDNLEYAIVYVEVADEGTPGYIAGSAGQIKTIEIYPTGAAVGALSKLQTFKYTNANFPTKFTNLAITDSTV